MPRTEPDTEPRAGQLRTGDLLLLLLDEDGQDGWCDVVEDGGGGGTRLEEVEEAAAACLVVRSPPFQPTIATDPGSAYCVYFDPGPGLPRCDPVDALVRPGRRWLVRRVSSDRLAPPSDLCRAWGAVRARYERRRRRSPGLVAQCLCLPDPADFEEDPDGPEFLWGLLRALGGVVADRPWDWADLLADAPLRGRSVSWEPPVPLEEAAFAGGVPAGGIG